MSDAADHGPNEDEILAAEYALGLLDARERRVLERRMRRDVALRRSVEGWEERLSPMLAGVSLAEPPPGVLAAVEAEIDAAGAAPRPSVAPANDNRVSRAWKWLGLGSSALLAASLAVLAVLVLPPQGAAPPMTAVIAANGGTALYAAVIDEDGRRAMLVPVATIAAHGFAHELWAIAPNAKPLSLGVLPAVGPAEIRVAPELLNGGGVLAISQEPPGGSPTGQPTGPVVATGELRGV